jgi:AcrR family transcriptional regulator
MAGARVAGTDRRQAQAAATRAQLLAVARDAFETRGYRATSVADIVQAAEVSRGTFYLYFENKQDVFAQVLDAAGDRLYSQGRGHFEPERPRESIAAGIRAYLGAIRAPMWRATMEAALESPELARRWLTIRDRFIARIVRHVKSSGVRSDLDPRVAGEGLAAMVEFFAATNLVLRDPPASADELDHAADTLAGMWLGAVFER